MAEFLTTSDVSREIGVSKNIARYFIKKALADLKEPASRPYKIDKEKFWTYLEIQAERRIIDEMILADLLPPWGSKIPGSGKPMFEKMKAEAFRLAVDISRSKGLDAFGSSTPLAKRIKRLCRMPQSRTLSNPILNHERATKWAFFLYRQRLVVDLDGVRHYATDVDARLFAAARLAEIEKRGISFHVNKVKIRQRIDVEKRLMAAANPRDDHMHHVVLTETYPQIDCSQDTEKKILGKLVRHTTNFMKQQKGVRFCVAVNEPNQKGFPHVHLLLVTPKSIHPVNSPGVSKTMPVSSTKGDWRREINYVIKTDDVTKDQYDGSRMSPMNWRLRQGSGIKFWDARMKKWSAME
ncbi:MAG: hypothetical protein HQL44_10345 [Alphaproteobacteria bacterium]|nr:hypothetical protein [Alphaproteobacteria bacterium]